MKALSSVNGSVAWAQSATIALLCVVTSACGLGQVGGDLADAAGALDTDIATTDTADATFDAADATVDAADVGADAGPDAADAVNDSDAAPDVGCTKATECDDGKACTTDTCDAKGGCVHTPWSASACDDGDLCTVDLCDDTTGCVHSTQPANFCDDGEVCTDDACNCSTGCVHGAISCNDSNACTQDVCEPGFGCSHILVPPDNCADGNACTVDACDPTLGCTHTAVDCKDADACTVDNCAAATGCVHAPVDATACSDNDACTTDVCISATGCVSAPMAATACDDNNACTQDACDASQGCTHLALDTTPCNDGDDCTSPDACVGGTCKGEVTHWLKPSTLPGGSGQWVGIAPRTDGTRLLIGWQMVAGTPPQRQMILQRINGAGEPQGPIQVESSLNDLVIDHVATNGPDVLVHGFRVESPGVTHPWYGLLDDNDQLFQSGMYDPPTSDATGGMPRTAFGLTIVPPNGSAPFTRWFTSVDSVAIGNSTRHAFYTIEAGSKPAWHSLGEGNEGCGALLIRDGVLIGTCDVKDSADYFRATFSATGKVLATQRTSPPVPLAFTAVTASLRADGHVWYVGHAPDAYAPTLVIGVDAKGKLLKITSPVGGAQGAVFGAIQETDGSSWLFGTTGPEAAMWRLDDDATLIGMHTYGPGAWLHGMRDSSGLWLTGAGSALTAPWPSASPGGIVARTDLWGAETCSNGAPCTSESVCADGNGCTNEWCTESGCMHTTRTLCEDGDPCTGGDKCASGACAAGATIACQDNNPCTLDACGATGCTFTPTAENTNCDDGNSCTTITHCIAGTCSIAATQVVGVGCGNGSLCIADGRCVQPWAAEVVAGGQHSCAVRPDGRIFCWGDNAFHELGNSDAAGSFIPLEVPGSSNWAPSSIVLGAGSGFNVAWIEGYSSALGWGRSEAFQANVVLASPFTMTATPQTVASGLGAFASISLGANHGCALDKVGAVACWGKSDFGQVNSVNSAGMTATAITGLGVVQAIGVGGNNSCAVQTDGTVQCWGAMAGAWHTGNSAAGGSTTPLTVLSLGAVSTIAIGAQHGCGILSNGTVRCWGANDVGQLGNGTVGSPAFAGATSAGSSKATQLAAGDAFTCMLATDGEVACWGDGSLGQMGNGGNTGNASPLVVPNLTGTVQITARGSHACARRFDGAVFCWGTGGIPGMSASAVPVPVPDSLP